MTARKGFIEAAARATRHPAYCIAGVIAAATAGPLASPSADTPLSTTAPAQDQAARQAFMKELTSEAIRLDAEFTRLGFIDENLKAAQANLGKDARNLEEQFAVLERQQAKYAEQDKKRNDDISSLHTRLLVTSAISEADAERIYTNALKGTTYAHYYTQNMAYRDECRPAHLSANPADISGGTQDRWQDCMTKMNDDEGAREFSQTLKIGGGVLGGFLTLSFAMGGLQLAGRSRQAGRNARNLQDAKDLLKPRGPNL